MFQFFYLLIISQILSVYSDLAEEKQYINDLNEDAKKEFIDRVVRRLAQEVDLKDAPLEESKKMTDEQLDQHSDFVKKIVNEEKVNFEKDVHIGVLNKEVSSEPRRLSNQSHIDLTLKEQTRKKRHGNSEGNNNIETTQVNEVTIPVQTIYDVDPNNGSESQVNRSLPEEKDDIQVKSQTIKTRRSAQKEENENPETESTYDSSTHLDNSNGDANKIIPLENSTESNKDRSVTEPSVESSSTVAYLENNTYIVKSTKEPIKEDVTSGKKPDETETETTTMDNGVLSDVNKVLRDSKLEKSSNEDNIKDNISATVTPKVKVSDVTSNQNIDTTSVTNTVNKENLPNVTEKQALSTAVPEAIQKENDLNTHLTKISISEITTSELPKFLNILNKTVENVNILKINDLILTYNPHKTEHDVKNQTSKLRSEKVKITKVGPSNKKILRMPTIKLNKNLLDRRNPTIHDDLRTVQIAEDVVKSLRLGIEKETKNKKKALNQKPNLKRKQINIYGLRSFIEEKSVEKDVNNREEPYYAPIYNYDPNNAYYNAYNKFGPNDEDSKNRANKPQEVIDVVDLLSEPIAKYSRSFVKKPLKLSKKILNRKPNFQKVNIDRILPFIVNKPYKLPQNDYEEYLGDDYIREKNAYRSGKKIKEADESLKNHLRHIRKTIYLRKEGKQNKEHIKDGQENRGSGWLDTDVKYYFENHKNVAKPIKPNKGFHSINYDYIGEIRSDKPKKLRKNPKFRYENVPVAKSHSLSRSREVITRINKSKNSDSKEIVQRFQKVFPLLKNLVQIVDDDGDEEVEACVKVMRDMINRNDEGLEQYDWLESTVNIQSAIGKLLDLTRAASEDLSMHPSDVELLKFTSYLYSVATDQLQGGSESFPSERARSPKSLKAKGHFVNHKELLDENNKWLIRGPTSKTKHKLQYGELRRFLNDLSDSLFDLHDALKHVSLVTNFRSQRWYGNLKDLYLHDPDRKKLLQVILHLGTTRLFNLIEDTSKNGVVEDFRRYIVENKTMVSGLKDAFVFVLKVLQATVFSR